MVIVIATIELQENRRDEFLKHFHQLVPLVEAEEGCLEYGPHIDCDTTISSQIEIRPNVVTVVEKWEDIEALEKHLVASHMITYRAQVKELVKHVTLQVLEPAAGA